MKNFWSKTLDFINTYDYGNRIPKQVAPIVNTVMLFLIVYMALIILNKMCKMHCHVSPYGPVYEVDQACPMDRIGRPHYRHNQIE